MRMTNIIVVTTVIVTILVGISLVLLPQYICEHDISDHTFETMELDIYGRDMYKKELLDKILSNTHKVVAVHGIVGVGKTTFVLNVTDILVKKHNYSRVYIDMSQEENKNILSLTIHLIWVTQCKKGTMSVSQLTKFWFLAFKTFTQSTGYLFRYWYNTLQQQTILILDHVDENKVKEEVEQKLIQPLSNFKPKAFVLILISRLNELKYLGRPVISLSGLKNMSQCAQWISTKYQHIDSNYGAQLCDELGGVPSDIINAIELVLHPHTSFSIEEVISGLSTTEYGKAFSYLESILGRHYKDTSERNTALYIHYSRLDYHHRECVWLLVEMRNDGIFTKEMAEQHLKRNINDCLDSLLQNSFLELINAPHKIFCIRPNVKKFIQYIGPPTPYTEDIRNFARVFYGNYIKYNSRNLYALLNMTHDLQTAISIGSNRALVNTLLPLLGDDYDLRPLFKISLEIIEENFCSRNTSNSQNRSTVEALLAFSYLTKAVRCPSFHPPEMMLKRPLLKQDLCFKSLHSCPAVLSIRNKTYEAREALGYHNMLLIYAADDALPTAPWPLTLIDISMIVSVANRECSKYCTSERYCQCVKMSYIEHGLQQMLVRNYVLSTKYFQSSLIQLSEDYGQCQNILKIIAVIGIDYANQRGSIKAHFHHHLMKIDFKNLNLSCFLRVSNDLIIPYLISIKHSESQLLNMKLNQEISKVNASCNEETLPQSLENLDCMPRLRYTIAHGLTALRMRQLQESTKWPQYVTEYVPREEWVCSVIKDKTAKCKKILPLISETRAIENTEHNEPLRAIGYFMEDEEYKQLRERANSIPNFFQYMSI